jgi:hypothetical protein
MERKRCRNGVPQKYEIAPIEIEPGAPDELIGGGQALSFGLFSVCFTEALPDFTHRRMICRVMPTKGNVHFAHGR